jgi:hypothetical protein
VVTVLIVLALAGLFALRVYSDELTEVALVPTTGFVEQDALATNAYQDPAMWFSRPGIGVANDPALWQPVFADDRSPLPAPADPETAPVANDPAATVEQASEVNAETPRFAVFFVHPTSFFDRSAWNAPLDDEVSQTRARIMVRGLASAFNQASEIWVPRYRQATFGAFLTDAPEATRAIDAAYADVSQAFDFFLDSVPADMPIVLAGHSQGAYLVTRLLQERVKGTALQGRIAMAYPIGWPISLEHDLPELGLSACGSPTQSGCVFSYASFAEPAEPGLFFRRYTATPGLDGQPRGESRILCVNPLTGVPNDTAEAALNLGTLVPEQDFTNGELVAGAVPARCDERGLLLIGNPPAMGNQTFPGNNYHLVDIPLFWKNLQQDVVTRMQAWQASHLSAAS